FGEPMAKTDPLKKPQRQAIADQLGRMLARPASALTAAAAAAAGPELGESLAVCTLTAEQVRHPPADLGEIARPTGTWHHQVHTARGATHAARTQVGGLRGADHPVTQVFDSPIAGKIDAAITWPDRKPAKSPA